MPTTKIIEERGEEEYFPAEQLGMGQTYTLPGSIGSEHELALEAARRKEEGFGLQVLAGRLRDLNPSLPATSKRWDLCDGVVSRIPARDIEYFCQIGGGLGRNRWEIAAHRLMDQWVDCEWIPGPESTLRLIERFAPASPEKVWAAKLTVAGALAREVGVDDEPLARYRRMPTS